MEIKTATAMANLDFIKWFAGNPADAGPDAGLRTSAAGIKEKTLAFCAGVQPCRAPYGFAGDALVFQRFANDPSVPEDTVAVLLGCGAAPGVCSGDTGACLALSRAASLCGTVGRNS